MEYYMQFKLLFNCPKKPICPQYFLISLRVHCVACYAELNTPSSGISNVNRSRGIIPVNLKIKNPKISTGFTREVYKSE